MLVVAKWQKKLRLYMQTNDYGYYYSWVWFKGLVLKYWAYKALKSKSIHVYTYLKGGQPAV